VKNLIDGYFRLRQDSEGLKAYGHLFEARPWSKRDDCAVRKSEDGTVLKVYLVEGDVEACILFVDGSCKTYS
jgi:hypothetical protein